ncbi:hypothetical protein BpHYR1_039608 [Brachionus plicatilis]|uniref:Uncharacterized protein n=1 Tax=Brachionus plicatilis TaxID=10195 RepID=A0A3M7P7S3_BRAPC|nr:hypothetical protein BpHYR1_039608 [Brachionus plicatilis]
MIKNILNLVCIFLNIQNKFSNSKNTMNKIIVFKKFIKIRKLIKEESHGLKFKSAKSPNPYFTKNTKELFNYLIYFIQLSVFPLDAYN